jgi:hypothetical protein
VLQRHRQLGQRHGRHGSGPGIVAEFAAHIDKTQIKQLQAVLTRRERQ